MGFYYEKVIRPILFRIDPEKAHDLGVTALDYLSRLRGLCRLMASWNGLGPRARPVEVFGLRFANAVGLAAGMDKNGRFWRAAGALGFGHAEIGTVTWLAQPGNDRPRLFRYPEQQAVINRMGFNNEGAAAIAARLKAAGRRPGDGIPLGINIGKSRATPLDEAVDDYLKSFHALAEYADYLAINVSSPNTPELRKLQDPGHLRVLLGELAGANRNRARKLGEQPKPLLLKIAPDLEFHEIDGILHIIAEFQLDGIIATNTTVARPGPFATVEEAGGLSGAPLFPRMLEVVNYIHRATRGRLPIVASGGIDSAARAGAAVAAGATLVQVYTGMIFRGPFIATDIARALAPAQTAWV
jgi:dihydroorotate dehydrogenase